MQLLERAEQLEQLQLLLNEAAEGNGHVAVLVGEAGAGKSAIVNIFTDLVGKTTRVLRGACENFGTAEPLGPLRDLAREAGWALSETLSSTESRIALFAEVFRLLNVGAATSLIVIEDIHWADDATLNPIWHGESRNRPSLAVKLSIRPMTASGLRTRGSDRAVVSIAIVDKGMEGQVVAKSVAERPEQCGELRGKSGLLGENKARKAARHYAKALSNHVASASRTWERRLKAERQSEAWNRGKRM